MFAFIVRLFASSYVVERILEEQSCTAGRTEELLGIFHGAVGRRLSQRLFLLAVIRASEPEDKGVGVVAREVAQVAVAEMMEQAPRCCFQVLERVGFRCSTRRNVAPDPGRQRHRHARRH
ncbi:MAG: hypothetical protein L0Y70_18365 [Gemmataceae bacterium]|nr:hypothetical protein [Gemmataceae bacterium]